jgi:hypothetical protein
MTAGGLIGMRRFTSLAVAVVAAVSLGSAQQPRLADLQTTAESSGYKSTSTYDDVVRFMKAVDAASPIVFYTTYGTTTEGRAMPMAVVGRGLKDASPAAVKATGKLRVHIQANVHAGEVEGKESAQILMRELALGRHDDWLQSMVFLITPIYNADGNEKFALTNRQRQNGPINGMGTRANAQNLNINRDYMKLDTPEARAFVKLMNDYDPHVSYDLHTSDGSYHGYYLTYSPPLNPDTSPTIMKIMTDEWFPYVTTDMKAKHGWDSFYYGNVSTPRPPAPPSQPPAAGQGAAAPPQRGRGRGQGAACGYMPPPEGVTREWRTFEHVPRFHNNYVGLRNRFALLSEAYAYATFEDRIKATTYFLDASLDFASANAAKLKKAVADADKEKVTGITLATSARMKRGGLVDILMGEVEPITNPNNQAVICNRKDVVHPEKMVDMMWFEPETTETVPAAYYVPADATKAIELLKAQGIQMRQAAITGPVEGFAITQNTAAQAPFEGHNIRRLQGTWSAKPDVKPGTKYFEVSTGQPLGRLAFYLLEPASDDGLVAWNYLDDQLKDATTYPILRRK